MQFELTKDYLTGIEMIDKEHAKLIQIINETSAILNDDKLDIQILAKNLVQNLSEYAATHFQHEEAYMEKINDPELPLQKKEHAAFIKRIQSIPVDDSLKVRDLEDMMEYLVRWLFHHILHSDLMIGKVPPKKTVPEDPFAFTDIYLTNIEMIDTEHRKLFDIIRSANDLIQNNLLHDKYDEILGILKELQEYTETHFNHEEEYMQEIGYPGLPAQTKAHNAFIEKLVNINYSELDSMDDNQQEYLEDIIEYLLQWLSNHILGTDKKIGEWLESQNN